MYVKYLCTTSGKKKSWDLDDQPFTQEYATGGGSLPFDPNALLEQNNIQVFINANLNVKPSKRFLKSEYKL